MADIKYLAPYILSFEGGFVDDKDDRGGATNRGVTLKTWLAKGYDINGDGKIDVEDLKLLSEAGATNVMKQNYWDKCKADEIKDQSVANIVVSWMWGSGSVGVKQIQAIVGVNADGIIGKQTIAAINARNGEELFYEIKGNRFKHFMAICEANPVQRKYLKGWLRRLESMRYGELICNGGKTIKW